jgi:hypothetical protein
MELTCLKLEIYGFLGGYLYELSNLILKRKFHYVGFWVNSETSALVPEMKIESFGFNTGDY